MSDSIPESSSPPLDHNKYTVHIPSSMSTDTSATPWKIEINSIVPLIGPLHISLNAREDMSVKQNKFNEYFRAVIRIWTMFYCFQRKHYNKAPLIWLSNVGYWAKSNRKLYETLEEDISCTDEYPAENAHSIIRSNTYAAEDCETISKKAKMIFTSRNELKNFKSVFMPPKSFSLLRNVLRLLKVKAAEVIRNLLQSVTNTCPSTPDLHEKLHLTNENIKCLPLGSHTNKPLNPYLTCDMPACHLQDKNTAWKKFNGCFHSFHLDCLKDVDNCPICRSHLQMVIHQLGSNAQQSIHNLQHEEYVHEENDDQSSENAPKMTAAKEDHLQAKVNDIKKKVNKINIPEPETCKPPDTLISTECPKRKQPRPPHCKTCGHPVKGHHTKQKIKMCTICPGQECSSSNKDTETQCPCEWHLQAGRNQRPTSRSSDYRYNVDKNVYLTTTEYILPNGLSQFSLS